MNHFQLRTMVISAQAVLEVRKSAWVGSPKKMDTGKPILLEEARGSSMTVAKIFHTGDKKTQNAYFATNRDKIQMSYDDLRPTDSVDDWTIFGSDQDQLGFSDARSLSASLRRPA